MESSTVCLKCQASNVYFDGQLWNCPDCGHDWTTTPASTSAEADSTQDFVVRDAFGNILADGDAVTLIKDLRIKGTSQSIKVGSKAKGIRLVDSSDGHNIACKVDGFGAVNLKSEFVKKS